VNPQEIEIALASGSADLAAVRSFYGGVRYRGGMGAGDRILVVRQVGSIIAAAKLSTENEILVLRGMYVSEPLRGQGIGSRLLARVSDEIGFSACWCIPYTHLERFYSRIGFRVRGGMEVPEVLSARMQRYVSAGREVTIMGRPAGWVPESA